MPTAAPAAPAAIVRKAKAELAADQKIRQLGELQQKTGRTIHDRARLAAELVADRDWLARDHGGDEGAAYDWLTGEYFHDLAEMGVSTENLVAVYRDVPGETWAAHKWNVRRVIVAWRAIKSPSPAAPVRDGEPPRTTRAVVEAKEQEIKELTFAVKRTQEQAQRSADEATTMRNRVRELELENAQLRGRLTELERIVKERAA
jgi:hypothetical protein